ncbi:MAG: baseplate J/gp47 family protein [Holosporaceae bacterium]|nr:baseplate J/gp47 family protein [Holosporaceae bacterium]
MFESVQGDWSGIEGCHHLSGISRQKGKATPTTTMATKGRPNMVIPENTVLKNNSGSITFLTTSALQLPDGPVESFVESSVLAACSQVGSIIVLVNELTQIDPLIPDVTIVANTQITIGTDEESDQGVKSRLLQSVGSVGMGFLDVMDSALLTSAKENISTISELSLEYLDLFYIWESVS